MVPLDPAAARFVRSWLGEPRRPGLLDLYHALAFHQRGLWGDDERAPRSVLLVREGKGQLEAFGAGDPDPAIGWLARRPGRTIALLAPADWHDLVEHRVGAVERADVLTWSWSAGAEDITPAPTVVATRRLTSEDQRAIHDSGAVPWWILLSWITFADLVEHGAGFVVPLGQEFAALSWIYSQSARYDAIGVYTAPPFRRLGLGRAAASALIAHIVRERDKIPLWTTTAENAASQALARSLGFSPVATETLLRWGPRAGTEQEH